MKSSNTPIQYKDATMQLLQVGKEQDRANIEGTIDSSDSETEIAKAVSIIESPDKSLNPQLTRQRILTAQKQTKLKEIQAIVQTAITMTPNEQSAFDQILQERSHPGKQEKLLGDLAETYLKNSVHHNSILRRAHRKCFQVPNQRKVNIFPHSYGKVVKKMISHAYTPYSNTRQNSLLSQYDAGGTPNYEKFQRKFLLEIKNSLNATQKKFNFEEKDFPSGLWPIYQHMLENGLSGDNRKRTPNLAELLNAGVDPQDDRLSGATTRTEIHHIAYKADKQAAAHSVNARNLALTNGVRRDSSNPTAQIGSHQNFHDVTSTDLEHTFTQMNFPTIYAFIKPLASSRLSKSVEYINAAKDSVTQHNPILSGTNAEAQKPLFGSSSSSSTRGMIFDQVTAPLPPTDESVSRSLSSISTIESKFETNQKSYYTSKPQEHNYSGTTLFARSSEPGR